MTDEAGAVSVSRVQMIQERCDAPCACDSVIGGCQTCRARSLLWTEIPWLLGELERLRGALTVIPPERLETLADWLDTIDELDGHTEGDEVQQDLRRMAVLSRAALVGASK